MNNKNRPMWPALIQAKCPRCRRGEIFANKMYSFHSQVMFKSCSHCDLVFEIEPGYFYVAMLVSYAMSVAEIVTLAVAISILTKSENPWSYVVIILSANFALSPLNFRYSRVILLYWLTPGMNYQAELSNDLPSENANEVNDNN